MKLVWVPEGGGVGGGGGGALSIDIKVYGKDRPKRVYFCAKAGLGNGLYLFLYILGKGMFFVKVVW
jgi:hypothetical protein